MIKIENINFFQSDAKVLAQNLIGKWIETSVNGVKVKGQIKETEAYMGIEDSACHSYKGKRTSRTAVMYKAGGTVYVYLCYGMHYLLNIVCGEENDPQAVLIRALVEADGPAKATKFLHVDKTFNGQSVIDNANFAIFDDGKNYSFYNAPRVGISYALEKDKNALLRFILVK